MTMLIISLISCDAAGKTTGITQNDSLYLILEARSLVVLLWGFLSDNVKRIYVLFCDFMLVKIQMNVFTIIIEMIHFFFKSNSRLKISLHLVFLILILNIPVGESQSIIETSYQWKSFSVNKKIVSKHCLLNITIISFCLTKHKIRTGYI